MLGLAAGVTMATRQSWILTRRLRSVAYTPEASCPGRASGAGPGLNESESSGAANAYPGVPAHPGTPISNPGENFTGRFGLDGPPKLNPPDQRVSTGEYDDAAESRAPSLLAPIPVPKAENAARFSAGTPCTARSANRFRHKTFTGFPAPKGGNSGP